LLRSRTVSGKYFQGRNATYEKENAVIGKNVERVVLNQN
jgi:hypothetical protein